MINIYYGEKVKPENLGEFELGLYDFLRDEFPSRESLEQALGEVEQYGDLSKDFLGMAINFQISAVEVASYMLNEKRIAHLDTLFFPMVYLFRQSLELLLKSLYFQAVEDHSDRKSFIGRTRHDLSSLYKEVTALSINSDQGMAGYQWASEFFENISMFDKMSDSFRYPYKFQITNDGFEERLIAKKVFEQRRDVDLIKLSKKFSYAFALLQRLIEETPPGCNQIPYSVDNLDDFIDAPNYSSEFLEEGGYYHSRSVVGGDYKPKDFNRFADAYSECAEYLYKKHKTDVIGGFITNISCFYPICYLLRNAIELSLKKLCTNFVENDQAIKLISTNKHNLQGLWQGIKVKHSEGAKSFIRIPHSEQIDFYVSLIHEEDGSSSRFRYPADNELKHYMPDPYRYHLGVHYYLLNTCFERIRYTEDITEAAME